jgi:hypothetical protein
MEWQGRLDPDGAASPELRGIMDPLFDTYLSARSTTNAGSLR